MLSKTKSLELLKPYLPALHECVIKGWNDRLEHNENFLSKHSPLSRALIIRDYIIDHARHIFEGISEVSFIDKGMLFLLCVDHKILIKFKKLNPDLSTCNIPTKQVKEYEQQTLFDGTLENATHLFMGYLPNPLWSSIDGVFLTCPNGKKLLWHEPVNNVAPLTTNVKELPLPSEGILPKRVRIVGVNEKGNIHEKGNGS